MPQYLKDDMPPLKPNPTPDSYSLGDGGAGLLGLGVNLLEKHPAVDWIAALERLEIDRTVKPVNERHPPGRTGAWATLEAFIQYRLPAYATKRNDPNIHACSDMSPYLKFGQIGALVCIYVYVYVYMSMSICLCLYVYVYVCMYMSVCLCLCLCLYVYVCMYVCMYMYMFLCVK